jgi:acyl carrier protein phosphodiesterase
MNILAHAWLACPLPVDSEQITPTDRERLVGGFIADFIKGDPAHPRHGLPPGVVAGVVQHRAIDSFTDAHPAVATVRAWLRPRCHKYAGVAVDVFFDHFLARDFTALTGALLADFVPFVYQTLSHDPAPLPPDARRMAEAMIRQNWLTNYQTTDGIDRTLKGLARRTAYPSGLDTVIDDLIGYYDRIEAVFAEFWPALTDFAQAKTS